MSPFVEHPITVVGCFPVGEVEDRSFESVGVTHPFVEDRDGVVAFFRYSDVEDLTLKLMVFFCLL